MTSKSDGLPLTIAEWPRNVRETVRVRLDRYHENSIIDIRTWYRPAGSRHLKPGKSGITLNATIHLPKMVAALTKALSEAERLGLMAVDDSEAEQ